MFKRLFWLMIGAGFGFGVSFWLMRFVRETTRRYSPERVGGDAARALGGARERLVDALREGRDAMRERESEIRAELARR